MSGCEIHQEFNPSCKMCNDVASVRKAAQEGNLGFADTTLIEKYAGEIDKIHQILGIAVQNVLFVSDESRVGMYSDDSAMTLSEILGFKVEGTDRLVDVAKKMREKSDA
jgi:hypothetical protein